LKPHQLSIRVYYQDTDAGGVVYHARYLNFAERGRTEMLRAAGFDQTRLREEQGVIFAVVSMNIDFRAPARLDDLLDVKSAVVKLGGASMEIQQDICREDKLLATLKVTLVCIDKSFKAVRLPKEVREVFA
jgi:acyl-CoA thioester hydrolase